MPHRSAGKAAYCPAIAASARVGGVTVGVDLLLLAIDRNLHVVRDRQAVTYGVMSADLAELAAARRVEVLGRKWSLWEQIHATDPRPTGDPLLDAALASLVTASRPPHLISWIREPRKTCSMTTWPT